MFPHPQTPMFRLFQCDLSGSRQTWPLCISPIQSILPRCRFSLSQVVLPINISSILVGRTCDRISGLLSKALFAATCGSLAVELRLFNTTGPGGRRMVAGAVRGRFSRRDQSIAWRPISLRSWSFLRNRLSRWSLRRIGGTAIDCVGGPR
ncbi:hypothetical protein RLV_4599 [Rhizobium leguminosarum bv. viciae]|nr:hypothetical protein RLV_4599 [Rhizobium leguminosarum bv. viciae]